MAITSTQFNTSLRMQFASGSYLDSAATPAAAVITLGFSPRYVRVVNETTRVQEEWFFGMAATKTLAQAAAGTGTLDTSSLIVVTDPTAVLSTADAADTTTGAAYQSTANPDRAAKFTIAAAVMAQNDQIRWQAFG